MGPLSLAELQRRFFASIASRPGEGSEAFDPTVVATIAPSPTLGAAERLDVYAGMYFARIRDCLKEDVPRTAELLGEERWESLTRAYLAQHRSEHPSVRHAGNRLAAFLAAHADVPPALAELARFEWARLEVFDAPDADALEAADLSAIPPERWGELRFRTVPAAAVFASPFPIHRVWGGEADGRAAPVSTALRIWRQGFAVYHAPMEPAEAAAMRALITGRPFAALCDAAAADDDPEAAATRVVGWLARWLADGVLAAPLQL